MAGNNFTQWTTAAVPFGSVLAVLAVLPPSHYVEYKRLTTTRSDPLTIRN